MIKITLFVIGIESIVLGVSGNRNLSTSSSSSSSASTTTTSDSYDR